MKRIPRLRRAALPFALAVMAAAVLAVPTGAATRKVPFGFLGVDAGGALLDPGLSSQQLSNEFAQMAATGVESVRIAVNWSDVQPTPTTTDWSASDALYAGAAAHGIQVLPTIVQAPPWARINPKLAFSPPADPTAFGRFVGLVVQRYGTGGAFWAQHPELRADPSTEWQIWNEPIGGKPGSASEFWQDPAPPEARYVAMLRASRVAIKAAEPQGKLVLASLFEYAWLDLADLYKHGAHGLFDGVAINLFTHVPSNLLLALTYTRHVMDRNGDSKLPLSLTEFSWPTAKGLGLGYNATPAQSSQHISVALKIIPAARKRLKLEHVYYYTWLATDSGVDLFDYAGLRHLNVASAQITPKLMQSAFRAAAKRLEGCTKSQLATACG